MKLQKHIFPFCFKITVLITVVFLMLLGPLTAQSQLGLDDRLYNGKFYNYFPPKNVKGHQFYSTPEFSLGKVWIGDREYNSLNLNFDILNQDVLLDFETSNGGKRIISFSLAYIDSFAFENKTFVINKIDSVNQQIEQEIKYNNTKFYLFYYKKMELQSALSEINYFFSKAFKRIVFVQGDNRVEVKSNKSFYKLFEKEKALSIKHYLKKNKLKLKKMTDEELLYLLKFINSGYEN